jgi:asparagine synthase (glutamine-hydrolysing)
MSAIAGIYNLNEESVDLEHGRRIMKSLEKFPADDIQTWHNEKVFLGCHARWITPESIGEKLPYYYKQMRLAITADAIIDNREELFERLQVDRARQKGITDSELILLSYEKWGEDCPKFLVGDFAFMIWDEREQKMFGARDFSGARTLYYFKNQWRFAFCTTIQPLLELPYTDKKLNEQWLAEFLAITSPVDSIEASITPYETIEQIPPSHCISVMNGKIKLTRYCTLTNNKKLKLKSNEEYVEAFQEVFQQAVNSCLRTYRGVGCQLSGGLDSGTVASFAVRALNGEKKLHTFSYIPLSDFVDFTPKHIFPDESPFIKMTVQHIGGINDHYLDFQGKNSYSIIDEIIDILETPYKFFQNSFWRKGMFEKAQEQGVGVLMSGGRGNLSISWGSALDYYSLLLKRMKWIRLMNELNQYRQKVGGPRLRRIPVIARKAFPFLNRMLSSENLKKEPLIINQEFANRMKVYHKLEDYGIDQTGWFSTTNIYKQRERHFQDVFHWNATSTFSAKLSLRYGLQYRDPTNDLRVIRFCLSLPEEQYVQNGLDRALIRRATENYLPDKVRLNQRYVGTQGADWVHRMMPYWDVFVDEVRKVSANKRILEFVDRQVIKEALSKIEKRPQPDHVGDIYYRIAMYSVILCRYLQQFD